MTSGEHKRKRQRQGELKVVLAQLISEDALKAFIDGIAELAAGDIFRRSQAEDESLALT